MKNVAAWLLLLVLGLACIVVGFRGSLGSMAAALITPAQLDETV